MPNMIGFIIGFIKRKSAKKGPKEKKADGEKEPGDLEKLKDIIVQKLLRPVLAFGLTMWLALRLYCFGLNYLSLQKATTEMFRIMMFFLIVSPIS